MTFEVSLHRLNAIHGPDTPSTANNRNNPQQAVTHRSHQQRVVCDIGMPVRPHGANITLPLAQLPADFLPVVSGAVLPHAPALTLAQTLGLSALPAHLQASLSIKDAVYASCNVNGGAVSKLPLWHIPGFQDRAWCKLADGAFARVRRFGETYSNGPGMRGGAGEASGSSAPAPSLMANRKVVCMVRGTVFNTHDDSHTEVNLKLPQDMLTHGLRNCTAVQQQERKALVLQLLESPLPVRVQQRLNEPLPALQWQNGHGTGNTEHGGHDITLTFRGDSNTPNQDKSPSIGELSFLSIEGADGLKIVLDEQAWLADVLKDGGIDVPPGTPVWELPDRSLVCMPDAEAVENDAVYSQL